MKNKQMKPALWGIGLLTCIALMGIQPAFAESSVSVNVMSSASSLPLDGEGSATTRVVKVSNLTLVTDSNKGFTITISSGNLTKASQNTPISYQVMTVVSGDNPPSSGDFTVASGNNYTFLTNQAGSQNRDLYILYTSASLQDPGTYIANITILIADNP
ncbi:hypothetical protein [Pseudanabaena sp. lw0831]|uniref:hypothetical protein n=1 Tax=Pseudanabaena sp. lw0831 TaxID=1357935 RepID=UPI001F2C5DC6|nr:hypothetical protein [Pseudanabaena sp. lw0831]